MVTEEQIKELAYFLWEQEDRQDGKDVEHYFRAKQMLEERELALFPIEEPLPIESAIQPPLTPKPVKRRTVKSRSKKL